MSPSSFHSFLQRFVLWALSILVSQIALLPTRAQDSGKAVQVIVPFSAGGGSDTLARFLVREINASKLDESPWVVINIPGAGGTIGSRHVKNSLPDGKTVLFLHDGILTAKLSGKAAYGPTAFEPIALTGKVGMVLAVNEASPFKDLAQLLDAAGSEPDTITFAANLGAPSYYMGKLIESNHPSAKFRFVQSGGGARRFADLSGGHIAVTVFSVSEFLSFRDGGLRGLAYFGEDRHPSLPEVPSARESSIDVVFENLQGWWAPLRTPKQVVEQLGSILEKAFFSVPVQEALSRQSIEPTFLPPDDFSAEVTKKEQSLERVSVSIDVRKPPRMEWFLLPFAAFLLFLIGYQQTKSDKMAASSSSTLLTKRGAFIALILIGYVVALWLTDGLFFWISSLFVFLLLVRLPLTPRRSLSLLVPSVTAPLILVLFIERLLGLPLP